MARTPLCRGYGEENDEVEGWSRGSEDMNMNFLGSKKVEPVA